jgi:hypothetical protein
MKLIPCTAALLAAGLMVGAHAATALNEGFDNVAALAGSGWVLTNASAPVGQDWFQGNEGIFAADTGAANSYIAASFLSAATDAGAVDNWLISPELTLGAGQVLTFSTRASDTDFLDLLEVRFSSGSSAAVGGFSTLLGTVGSALSATYPVAGWVAYSLALPTAATGRVAFRYTVASASNASYIGIDSVVVSSVPEPATLAMFGIGLAAFAGGARRRKQGALALAAALTVGAPMATQAAEALRVVRDPVTGEMRGPNAAEAAAFQKAEAQLRLGNSKTTTTKGPVEIRYPDGTIETKLGEDSMMYSVVRANEDGTLAMQCLPAKEAKAFVKSAKSTAAALTAPVSATKAKAGKAGHNHE